MSDSLIKIVTWLALATQLLAGIAVWRHKAPLSLIVTLNLVAAGCVLAYWVQRWYGYLFRGITWYATDQLIPLCALLVFILAVLTLTGRYQGVALHWMIFAVTTLILIAAALFFTFFKMKMF
jgi:hypothetical protein